MLRLAAILLSRAARIALLVLVLLLMVYTMPEARAALRARAVTALREQLPATEAELGDLARARTRAIRDALLGAGGIDAARVFVLGIKPVVAVEGKVRVELSLK